MAATAVPFHICFESLRKNCSARFARQFLGRLPGAGAET
jgi:hypothetical protein